MYWKQRGTINWTLKGDSPTAYFFAIVNGRRRRCLINSLIIDGVRVSEPPVILHHVVRFFSNLLSAKPDLGFALAPGFWAPLDRISHADNELLLIPLLRRKFLILFGRLILMRLQALMVSPFRSFDNSGPN